MKIDKNGLCLALALSLPLAVFGYDGTWTQDGVTFGYDVSGDEACVSIASCGDSATVVIPSEIDGYKVTSIGETQYSCHEKLASVVIPSSVTSIGNSAFYNCSGLTSVTIPSGVTSIGHSAFEGCSGLTSVTIPSGVTSIGHSAFEGCSGLTSVTIPNSVTSIGFEAFKGCQGLADLDGFVIVQGVLCDYVGGNAVVTIPSSVTSIGSGAFSGCSSLASVTIPTSVTSIGSSAFFDCRSLTTVTMPNSVTSIGYFAFCNCYSLTSVTIPDSVTSIGYSAFEGCSGLTSVTLPNSVTSIGFRAFKGCQGLADLDGFVIVQGVLCDYVGGNAVVTIPSNVTSIGHSAFRDCSSLTSVTIPDSVTSIGEAAFKGCQGLADLDGFVIVQGVLYDYVGSNAVVTIPSSVTNISWHAFSGSSGLTSVTIPSSVTSIGYSAFWFCSGLTSVTIPDSVREIGQGAFFGCNLSEVSIPADATIAEGTYASFDPGVKIVRRQPLSYANLKGAANTNPTTYEEGKALALAAPGAVTGYTFAGWTPSAITADMTGAQTVTANWTANRYQIVYKANDASGETAATDCEYDAEGEIASNAFVYAGFVFKGWATEEGGEVVYAPGDKVTNLTSNAGGVVTLYAVWEAVEPTPLTWAGILDEDKLGAVSTGGDAAWQMEETDGSEASATPKVGDSFAVSGVIAEGDETERTSWLKVAVNGRGTLSFWWKVDCEPDPRGRFTYDYGKVETNGTLVVRKDGTTDWMQQTVTFDTDGEHEIVWTYVADGYTAMSGSYAGRIWLDGLSWSGDAAPIAPTVEGDDGASVTGDAETGFVVTPSEGAEEVVVTIPDGVDAAKVTVVVSPETRRVTPNGAAVRVLRGTADITDCLDIPPADASGVIDLNAATVKEEIVKAVLSIEEGAEINLSAENPVLTTAETKSGLTYQLYEGATLSGLKAGDSTVGDGSPWTPKITEKGDSSGFYTIQVTK